MRLTISHRRQKTISRSSECQLFSQENILTMALHASCFLPISKKLWYMSKPRLQVNCKYHTILIFRSSFGNVVKGVNTRLLNMRRSAFVRFWKQAILAHFKYICLERIWSFHCDKTIRYDNLTHALILRFFNAILQPLKFVDIRHVKK